MFEIANFVALAVVLAWLFFKPVRRALEEQQAKAKRHEEEAAEQLATAERLRKDIESHHETLATELETLRLKAIEAAKQEAEQIVTGARTQAERERATLKRDALHIEHAQTAKLARAVATATHDTISRFLQQLNGPELQRTLVTSACRELQSFSNNSLAPVTVESATPLDDELRQVITSSLGSSAKTVDFRVKPELQGGLRISTAHGLIDASIAGLASFAEQSLSTQMELMLRENSGGE